MRVHVFRGAGRVFGFTLESTGANLPRRYGAWSAFKVLDMTRGEAQAGVNVDECLDDIEKHSFHLTDAHIRITENVA